MRIKLKDKYNYSPLHNKIRLINLRKERQNIIQNKKLLEKQLNLKTTEQLKLELPIIPSDRVEWEYYCRSIIKGKPNRLKYLPMLLDVVQDKHPFKFLLWARQWGKTTMLASDLAHAATTNYDYDQTYFNFKLDALRTFSNNKFRQDVFGKFPLSKYIKSIGSNIGALIIFAISFKW